MTKAIVCRCSEIILKSTVGGDGKVRAKIILIRGADVYAVCKGCNTEVRLPLQLSNEAGPPLILRT